MHGTFLRFDPSHSGKVTQKSLEDVSKILKIRLPTEDANALVTWFDTDGSKLLDYNEFTKQLYGGDVLTRPLSLPSFSSKTMKSSNNDFSADATCTSIFSTELNKNTFMNVSGVEMLKTYYQNAGVSHCCSSTSNKDPDMNASKSSSAFSTAESNIFGNTQLNENLIKTYASTGFKQVIDNKTLPNTKNTNSKKVIETRAKKVSKIEQRKKQMIMEKALLESKLRSIVCQEKSILSSYHSSRKEVK